MGRLLQDQQQCTPANMVACTTSPYEVDTLYDLGGKPTSATFPSNAPTTGSTTPAGQPVTLAYTYDNAERLVTVGSSWSDSTTHPAKLFQASSNSSAPGYGPMGLQNASLGVNTVSNVTTAALQRAYDVRGRINLEEDGPGNTITTGADSSGSITISGAEGSVTKTNTPGSVILGPYYTGGTYQDCVTTTTYIVVNGGGDVPTTTTTCTAKPNNGTFQVTIQSPTPITASYSWGPNDTASTISQALANGLNASGSPVTAVVNSNNTITITSNQTGLASNYPVTIYSLISAYAGNDGVYYSPSTSTANMSGGWTAGTYYDTGTITATISDTTAQVNWVPSSTPSSLAATLATSINAIEGIPGTSCPTASQISTIDSDSGGFVTACASGGTVTLTSLNGGPETNWSVTASETDTNPMYFSASGPNSCSLPSSGSGCYSARPPSAWPPPIWAAVALAAKLRRILHPEQAAQESSRSAARKPGHSAAPWQPPARAPSP